MKDIDEEGAQNTGSNLFVTGIHPRLTESDVSRLFEKYGVVENCSIMLDPHTKESRGFGFVKMVTTDQAEAAKEGLQGEVIEGRTLSIEKARRARPRSPTPGKYFGPPKRGTSPIEFVESLLTEKGGTFGRGPPRGGGYRERYDDRRGGYPPRRDDYRGGSRYDDYERRGYGEDYERRGYGGGGGGGGGGRRDRDDSYGGRNIDRYESRRDDTYGGRGGGGGGSASGGERRGYYDRSDDRGYPPPAREEAAPREYAGGRDYNREDRYASR